VNKLNLDWGITPEKLDSMVLADTNSRSKLHKGEGYRVLVKDEGGTILAYMCLKEIAPKNFICYLTPAVFFFLHGVRVAKITRDLLWNLLAGEEWDVVQTVSKDDKIVNRWMKFLGFDQGESVEVPNQSEKHLMWRRVNSWAT